MICAIPRIISAIANNAMIVAQSTPGYMGTVPARMRMIRPTPISSIRSYVGLFFSLVVDGGGSGDADAQANALPHFEQNEVLVGLAAPQYLQNVCSVICVHSPPLTKK